jgi:hypothetical protein
MEEEEEENEVEEGKEEQGKELSSFFIPVADSRKGLATALNNWSQKTFLR